MCVYIQAMLGTPAVPFELQHVLEPYHHWHEDDNSLPPVKIVLKQSQHFTRTKDTVFILQAYEKSWLHKMCLCDANNSSLQLTLWSYGLTHSVNISKLILYLMLELMM